ncbi:MULTISPECIES: hypothetical protein [Methylobacterium]|jgi:hypothetical protein|uniref:hypothetical protein n=1 Tax=Methylobacterium TaxID=407 RepID=UPI0008DFA150|nr:MULTISPECIES: hypothetical protein [Methylobacterium]MBZ6412688.1 hypothetical protein [Methylobacterium sp.]MBK3398512.1 hypothetical protein [Methylobacterium ajmalii]MBK3407712.1 hypothetical protein [Methylobacterium ajmalii]MBK3422199.1 hypothetical protein [Methylobacterium ajmalii]SFF27966.1 hypothetical protein SAMN04487844_11394 [Methylobacterium sp. yr596]
MCNSSARLPAIPAEYAAAAARIEAMWEAGRVCPFVGRGLRARVVEAGRLAAGGEVLADDARRVALEAENVATAFGPLRRAS